jgi:hypothetical protein
MSLINDALKRAQKQQQAQPASKPPLEFLPPGPAPASDCCAGPRSLGITLVLLAVLGFVAILAWLVSSPSFNSVPVAARPATRMSGGSSSNPPAAAVVSPAPLTNPTAAATEPAVTNAPVAASLPPGEPLRLQGISFNPNAPSAVVNGRVLYLGDTVNGYRLTAVSPVAVTLERGTESLVLDLSR